MRSFLRARPHLLAAIVLGVGAVAASSGLRLPVLALALLLAGWWWGSARLDALDRSVLLPKAETAGQALVAVTGPARRSRYELRVPAQVRRFRDEVVREPVLLRLPPGRSPPQGALLDVIGEIKIPRGSTNGFDERTWLRRHGVHVVLRATRWRVVGRRGGLAGFADGLRARLARSMAPGLGGERRAVLAGIVLGEDEGLSDELRARFRASGLYHVLAVGWQPSVVRAGIAGALASLAWLASRPQDRWYFLLLGAAILLAWNPYSLLDAGFQLSFAAVAAIFVAVPRLERSLTGYPVPRSLAEAVAVSSACGLATAPILLTQFGSVPIYSIPANALAALVGGLPYAAASPRTALAVIGLTIALALLAARLRPRRAPRLAVLALMLVLVAGGWRLRVGDAGLPPLSGLRITFLDVGQGDGALLQVPEGAVLVDEGPPEADVEGQLRALGIRRLAMIVLTHPQRDHVGGAADVLEHFEVGSVLDPGLPTQSSDEKGALAAARRRHVRVILARAGQAFRLGRLGMRVLWPDGPGTRGDDPNNHAVVLIASYGQTDALLTADAESDVTGHLHVPPVEIVKVAHHGSDDPGLADLLAQLHPRIAVISVGAHNDYGHPSQSTITTLSVVPGLAVYRTDRDGRVVVESEGGRITVR